MDCCISFQFFSLIFFALFAERSAICAFLNLLFDVISRWNLISNGSLEGAAIAQIVFLPSFFGFFFSSFLLKRETMIEQHSLLASKSDKTISTVISSALAAC